jgi:beta-galactosidase
MCGEYWDGWFDHWGEKHHRTDGAQEAAELKWMLGQGYSVNLYMFHGGTTFGWMNGANSNGKSYEPDTTSYDYDAPVSEGGELSAKYSLFRDAIRAVTGVTPPDPPAPIPVRTFATVKLNPSASLWDLLPAPINTDRPQPMERFGQSYGYILYRTAVSQSGELRIDGLHSYAQVYVDRKLVGTLDRRLGQNSLQIQVAGSKSQLDLLVENTGRANFGHQFPHEWAGINDSVALAGKPLAGWQVFPLPFTNIPRIAFKHTACTGACIERGEFEVDEPADTYLDTRGIGKGMVWVNGQPLGRFWATTPQHSLYLPASWLKKGRNEIVVFDLEVHPNAALGFLAHPIFDER